MQIKNNKTILVILLAASIFTSCKKNNGSEDVSADDKLKDSTLSYAREIYLWYNQIPASFNARQYADPNKIMEAIRPYSIEPGFTQPVDRFSFAIKQAEYNNLSNGISADFGLGVFFMVEGDLRVKSVERESAAGRAGVKRGWRVTKINGNTNITTSNSDFIVQNVFYSASSTFTFLKPDGSSVDITLIAAGYKTHPVMVDSVYTSGTKKIGYMVFNSFLGDTTEISSEFARVFNRFSTNGVTDVVIDLRYNGGGYVSIAERLTNYLAPTSANGTLMMMQKYNDKYTKYNTSTNFKKAGPLNPARIVFIVSPATASASELLINNLTPLSASVDVKLIGRDKTYGKPVGFFPIPVGEWYIFPVSFKTVNQKGESNYFNGFTPNAIVADGLDKNFGDITEASLASAIKYITTGAFRLQAEPIYTEQPQVKKGNSILDANTFKGTLGTRKGL